MTFSPYCPPHEGTPPERMAMFVDYWRRQPWDYDPHPKFDSAKWDITGQLKRRRGRQAFINAHYLTFTTLRPGAESATMMAPPLADFARAWLKASCGVSVNTLRARLGAVRCLEAALAHAAEVAAENLATVRPIDAPEECSPSLSGCGIAILDDAAELARGTLKTRARHVIQCIGQIARFLDENGLTSLPVGGWVPPTTVRETVQERSGAAFEEMCAKRMPSEEFLSAFPIAYGLATEASDVIVVSVCAVLLSASVRINEAVSIEPDAFVEATAADGTKAYGIRCPGSKGFAEHIKWILAPMVEVARDALQRLEEVTAEGRRIKAWYDAHPGQLYLPPHLEHLRGAERLTARQAAQLLGRRVGFCLDRRCVRDGLAERSGGSVIGASARVSFASIEAHILQRLPARMRDAGGPSSHPLLIVQEGTFERRKKGILPSPCMFQVVAMAHVYHGLKPRRGRIGVIQAVGLDPDSRIGAATHSFRHYNDTTVAACLSQDDRAVWAGRLDPRQNATYDHEGDGRLRSLVSRAKPQGPRAGQAPGGVRAAVPTPAPDDERRRKAPKRGGLVSRISNSARRASPYATGGRGGEVGQ